MAKTRNFWKTAAFLGGVATIGKKVWQKQRAQQRSQALFRGKVAIVTGGASGIGAALCDKLGRRGATVIVADINGAGAEQTAVAIRQAGGGADAVTLDVSDPDAVTALVNKTAWKHHRLDYLFNNAGIGISGDVANVSREHWKQIIDVNLNSVIAGSHAAYKVMRQQGFGHIVNTASMAGLIPLPSATPYSATKFGVVGLSTTMRIEAAPHGVRVSVVCPGFIDTPIFDRTTYVSGGKEATLQGLQRIHMTSAADCAEAMLLGVAQNKAIIPVGVEAKAMWTLYRINPAWGEWLLTRLLSNFENE